MQPYLRHRLVPYAAALAAVLILVIAAGGATASPPAGAALTVADRVACQTAVEEVYWQARIWPEANPGPKPTLAEVMPAAAVEAKVRETLAQSAALEAIWGQPITPAMLQAELERMAASSQRPELLADLFAALDGDPYLAAECLARPALAGRLLADRFAADARFAGQAFSAWWAETRDALPVALAPAAADYTLPAVARQPLLDDAWIDVPSIPVGTLGVGVWTGSEMLFLPNASTQGHRYNPATDTWQTMTTVGAPHSVWDFTAVWSGTEMITWGGCNGGTEFCTTSAGGRYNPATDSWTPTSTAGAPDPRRKHGAVWTGSLMIVWAGCREDANGNQNCNIELDDGGRYDPASNSWQPVTTAGAPTSRNFPDLIWTDDEMIVWSGTVEASPGGRYNPATDTWAMINTANAPAGREAALVWTGTEMIAWGGCTGFPLCDTAHADGGRYDPDGNTWTPTSAGDAPSARWGAEAVWTGTEMILFGGRGAGNSYPPAGARYDPSSDTWAAISTSGAPVGRILHQAVWTGTEMLIWGGFSNSGSTRNGARYNPASDGWTAVSANDSNSVRTLHTALWTGAEMIAWGGIGDGIVGGLDTGRRYDPATNSWASTSLANAPSLRFGHSAVWTGIEMIIWGGDVVSSSSPGTGGRYNPLTDAWTPTSTAGAPEASAFHSAVWTGSQMIVWGGSTYDNPFDNSGGRYTPATNSWSALPAAGVPAGRYLHTAAWTGDVMLVWGGAGSTGTRGDGARYDPDTNAWTPMNATGAPSARVLHTGVWTGEEWIIWGGALDLWVFTSSGGRYDPVGDSWTPTSTTAAPIGRARHEAVWTGTEMIVWGGCTMANCLDGTPSGGRYTLASDSWQPTTEVNAPEGRYFSEAVWTGTEMIVWAGETNDNGYTNTGGRYAPAVMPAPAIQVDPPALAQTLDPGQQATVSVTIANAGTADLEWTIAEAADGTCDPADIPWASVDPAAGTTAAGGSTIVDVTFDAAGLAPGSYGGALCIASNDPAAPQVAVPLTLTVIEPPNGAFNLYLPVVVGSE